MHRADHIDDLGIAQLLDGAEVAVETAEVMAARSSGKLRHCSVVGDKTVLQQQPAAATLARSSRTPQTRKHVWRRRYLHRHWAIATARPTIDM